MLPNSPGSGAVSISKPDHNPINIVLKSNSILNYNEKKNPINEKKTNEKKESPLYDKSELEGKTNDERLVYFFNKIILIDPEDHKKRGLLMTPILLFLELQKITQLPAEVTKLLSEVLISVFSTSPPFSVITPSYRQIYFNPISISYDDVTAAYKLFSYLPKENYPIALLKSLLKRFTSASINDRNGAKRCMMTINGKQIPMIIHLISLSLTPPPPHGVKDLLEVAVHFLTIYKPPPPPLFDNFFITSNFDEGENVLSINSVISEARLNDGITIFNELWATLRMLHYAPHYQSFNQPLLQALSLLIGINENFAHDIRRFIVHHWPRLDPRKAFLFMQEATAVCQCGPPVEEGIWENLSYRASSIDFQIAMEGLNFIEKTISKAEGFDHSVLTFLLQDTMKNHWHNGVKKRAEVVLEKIPKTDPRRPEFLPFDKWAKLRDTAAANYPSDSFEKRRIPGQVIKKVKN